MTVQELIGKLFGQDLSKKVVIKDFTTELPVFRIYEEVDKVIIEIEE